MSAVGLPATATAFAASGKVVVGSYNYNTLDPGSGTWTGGQFGIDAAIYDGLFLTTMNAAKPIVPELATSYKLSKNLKTLTLNLRHGVNFSDGTPFNAAAVKFNFTRPNGASTTVSSNFAPVKSVTTKGQYQVIMHFKTPDALMPQVIATTGANFIVSPTALQKEGADKFSLSPVGAGPFMVSSNQPAQQLDLVPNPHYWNASKVKLSKIEYLNVGTDPTTALDDLSSGAIQSYPVLGVTAPPTVLKAGQTTAGIVETKNSENLLLQLNMNTQKPPFNRLVARQALAYCIDRNGIAQGVGGGLVNPAPIGAGPGVYFYPKGGLAAAAKLNPYPFNVAKAKALVQQAGGMTFSILASAGQTATIATALQQDWTGCGMKVTVTPFTSNSFLQNEVEGSYQLAISQGGGTANPGAACAAAAPIKGTISAFYLQNAQLAALCTQAQQTTSTAALYKLWSKYWALSAKLAFNNPIVSSENLYFDKDCLTGTQWVGPGLDFAFASSSC